MGETKIIGISGFEEVGTNMVAIKSGRDIVVIDCGFVFSYAMLYEDIKTLIRRPAEELQQLGAIPNYHYLERVSGLVRAFIFSHGHLDHIGAFPKIAEKYKDEAQVIASGFTMLNLLNLLKENKIDIPRENRVVLKPGEAHQVGGNIGIKFFNMTHSIPDTVGIAIHTTNKTIVYLSDYKLDNASRFGPPDMDTLRALGKEGVDLLLIESTRANELGHTPSERVAEAKLADVLSLVDDKNGLIVTTYASHIERIGEILKIVSEDLGRTPVIIGRSMARSVDFAVKLGLLELPEGTKVIQFPDDEAKTIEQISQNKTDYALIVTGHQGEPDAVLSKMVDGKLPYRIGREDFVVFSSSTVPNPLNEANRWKLITKLERKYAQIFLDVHVSGHAMSEDHRKIIEILNPDQIIPLHGEPDGIMGLVKVAENEGYLLNDDLHILRNGQEFILE